MTSFVLTLIGNAATSPLQSCHIERVWAALQASGEENWLAQNEACDLVFESTLTPAKLSALAHDALSGKKIDVACTPVEGRRKKLLISDMDSTVIDQECIDELGEETGFGQRIKEITIAVVGGNMSFSDALRKRLSLMKGMELALLDKVYEERISLNSGARTLVQTMRKHGAYCILVSGGFSYFTSRIAQRLGFHDHQGNELLIKDEKLTGEIVEPILGRSAKLTTLIELCSEKGLTHSQVLAVGDGANDAKMIKEAGLGVAFHGSSYLKDQANASIEHNDLTALLYIQGYQRSEFVYS